MDERVLKAAQAYLGYRDAAQRPRRASTTPMKPFTLRAAAEKYRVSPATLHRAVKRLSSGEPLGHAGRPPLFSSDEDEAIVAYVVSKLSHAANTSCPRKLVRAMEQAHTPKLATGSEPNPVDRTGLCLLSLDGGGVRGLSTLYILKSVMTLLNHERKEIGLPSVKPCDIFDLIGGTSTGGLIAVMLGRLEMDVDECISAYSELMEAVFNERLRRIPIDLRGRVEPRFDSIRLKDAIEAVISRKGMSTTDLLNDGQDRGCKVFVCTAAKELYGITRLRSYELPQKPNLKATICEAALATSAATGFFTPVKITSRTFVDGALGANNPVDQVEEEAADIWCPKTGELRPLVKCFISIGTGNPGKKPIEDNILKFLSKTLVQITTETEETARRFIGRWRQHYDSKRYFRFNVEQGLQDVGLAEYKEQGTIMEATDQYLDEQTRVSQVRDCVENLIQKQNRTEIAFGATVEAYHTRVVLRQHAQVDIPQHSIPFSKNCQFVGRSEILKTVREKLFGDHGHRRIALVGLGGVGKTQVALHIAHWTKENKSHWSVFWMSAFSRASFERASLELVEELGIEGVENGDPKQLLRRYLRSSKSGNWLLIVDNADDEEVVFGIDGKEDGIYDYLPQTDRGRILSTTRSRQIAVDIAGPEVVDVSQMSENEARELLGKGLTNKTLLRDDKSVVELLDFLAYLPLAINQAAAYLNKTTNMVVEYLRLLRNTEQDLVELLATEFRDVTRYPRAPNAVATTWIISFKQIQKDKDAANLLFFMSYTEPRAIPRSMLPGAGSEQRTTRAIGILCGYSFLSSAGPSCHDFQYRANGQVKEAVAMLEHVVAVRERTLSEEHPSRLASQHVLASAYEANGQVKEAVEMLGHVVAVHGRTLSEEHPDRLASQHELARAYQANGQVKEAVELLEHVVTVRERTLSEEHPDRLASQHELASAYEANGQVKKAVGMLEHVVAVRERTLSKEHPDQLASQHELAIAYRANGQVKEAVAMLEHVVAVHGRTLSEEHPSRLASQLALASAYEANGQVKEAVAMLEHVVAVHGRTLSEEHPSRLASQLALASAYEANGQVKEAVEMLGHVVAVHGRTLSEEHPSRLASQLALASAYQANGQEKDLGVDWHR
ncbi:hypothetical protein HIM_11122 [Hirsutella minnesotensis 3608]|uniref:PNPLA domain-containing protein n=1 Tax=Hirsutella minnesotensis 3608 TaxID=1043627 RepID=A0A0F7ZJB2_9HYPO|nr:hypothetical protein HIM_11122 [Hirsutella minnesotensis 3608]